MFFKAFVDVLLKAQWLQLSTAHQPRESRKWALISTASTSNLLLTAHIRALGPLSVIDDMRALALSELSQRDPQVNTPVSGALKN
ncbi:hypothetical protein N7478_010059 [Penicillium angulare]|uniref:uncharacterized protein n=1 Tax=Penicillium angulare TaxID=116970 RepID=UPI0025424802|nr:uncharacterized protein N7478_010059 [Penicillium angulare]KAJ5267251.1 hypothetical protein N7478_010059 [Penicillium angulare]